MLKKLMLQAALVLNPLMASAEQTPLQLKCFGENENLKVTLEVFFQPDLRNRNNSFAVIVREFKDGVERVVLLEDNDLEIGGGDPIFLKSRGNGLFDFFINMSFPTAEYQGLYTAITAATEDQIGLVCKKNR